MKKKNTLITCVLLIGLLAAGSFGAQQRTREPGQYAPASGQAPSRAARPGLQVTSSEAGTVSGSFTTGGYTIYFETVRGEANESGDTDAPLYGMDIRVMDWNHMPFLVQTACSTPVTGSWIDQAKNEDLAINREERHRAFAMLPATAKALKSYAKKRREAISDLDRSDLEQVIALLESVTLGDLQDFDSTPEAAMTPQAVTYSHKATIKKKTFSTGGVESEHSALLLQIYTSGGSLLKQYSYSNHGAAATDASMSTKCSKTFIKGNTNVYTANNMCELFSSPYFTQTWDKHGHTCNNDTLQQYLSVKGGGFLNWGICNFNLAQLMAYYRRAPDCQ